MLRRTFQLLVTALDIETKLKANGNISPTSVSVKDVSAGCGSFFQVEVVSPVFEGKGLVQQHRMVNEALREEIKVIHGLTINTRSK